MQLIEQLAVLRNAGGAARTRGLDDATVLRFAATSPELVDAVAQAHARFLELAAELPQLIALDEVEQMRLIQADFVNFYTDDSVNPYVALAASGPWIVTLKGAVKSYWDWRHVFAITAKIPGVQEVKNEVLVQADPRPDDVIKDEIVNYLEMVKAIDDPDRIAVTVPSVSSMMLAGLRSRCTMPWRWV